MFSCVLILPIGYVDEGNTMGEILGYGSYSFTVPLSNTGNEPITHVGLHSWVEQSFIDMMNSDIIPNILLENGFTQEQYTTLNENMIKSYWDDYVGHFDTIIKENNLQIVDRNNYQCFYGSQ